MYNLSLMTHLDARARKHTDTPAHTANFLGASFVSCLLTVQRVIIVLLLL